MAPRKPTPTHESFPLPTLLVSLHHTFTLSEGKSSSDSAVGIRIKSANFRFSPFLAVFIDEAMYYSALRKSYQPNVPSPPLNPNSNATSPSPPASPASTRGTATVAIKMEPVIVVLEGGDTTEIVCT